MLTISVREKLSICQPTNLYYITAIRQKQTDPLPNKPFRQRKTMRHRHCLTLILFLILIGSLGAQQAGNVQEAVETVKQSLDAMRGSYTADVSISGLDDAGVKEMPVISYKQRVYADGNADFQASMDRVPLPDEVPQQLGEVPLKFVSTPEMMALQLDDTAVQREGRDPKMEEDLIKIMTTALNDLPMPSDEELAAMDLRQEPEVIDGVLCQTLTWVPDDYDPQNPKSVAMHCLSFSTEDHVLRAYVALDKDGKELFSLKFSNVDTNPSFGPEDFRLDPNVKVIKAKDDKEFGTQVQALFMAKFIKAAITPKGKRRRTTGTTSIKPEPKPEPEPEQQETTVAAATPPPASEEPPPSSSHFYYGLAIILILLLILLLLMRRRANR